MDARLVGVGWQLGLGDVHLLAHVLERPIGVEACIEFERDRAVTLGADGAHLLDALDGLKLLFHRTDE